MKFRKRPVVIEAIRFTESMAKEDDPLPDGVVLGRRSIGPSPFRRLYDYRFYVRTLEGEMDVRVGDWIITGIKGEQYSCKPDIFAMTYEPVLEFSGERSEPQDAKGENMEHESLESQVERLANFIMAEVPGEPSQSEGAIDTAIRVIRKLQKPAPPAPADEERRRTIREWVNIQRSRLVDELAQANCPWAEIDLNILNDLLALLQAPPAAPVRVTRKWLILLAQELDHALMDEVDSAYWGWGPVDRRLCSLGITVIDGEGEKK